MHGVRMDSAARAKLDPTAREFLSTTRAATPDDTEGAGQAQTVRVLARGRTPFTPSQLQNLEHRGVHVATVAGDILTASVDGPALERLAEAEFIGAVELSVPLEPESDDDMQGDLDVEPDLEQEP